MVGKSSYQVLLVDDEPPIRKLASEHLAAAGYVVRTAVDGLDALGELREGLPDIVVSDLNMPHMSGFEFLGVVRKRFPQIPVIVISGAADEMPEGVPADAYFPKDGSVLEQLQQAISDLTSKPPLRTAPPRVDNQPVPAKWDGNGHYTLDCVDCLRAFSFPRALTLGRDRKSAVCVHCGRIVRFLAADEDTLGPPRP